MIGRSSVWYRYLLLSLMTLPWAKARIPDQYGSSLRDQDDLNTELSARYTDSLLALVHNRYSELQKLTDDPIIQVKKDMVDELFPVDKRNICTVVCAYCETLVHRRWSALCETDCRLQTSSFNLCIAAWRLSTRE
ncbi:hypothetical protein SNE40_015373 [Patella caerulea]|uniref:Uncharacterized protein n=1 Tax=Patella caerulea TaxID=87958 RepID=A0AAN8JHS6_PATCE